MSFVTFDYDRYDISETLVPMWAMSLMKISIFMSMMVLMRIEIGLFFMMGILMLAHGIMNKIVLITTTPEMILRWMELINFCDDVEGVERAYGVYHCDNEVSQDLNHGYDGGMR